MNESRDDSIEALLRQQFGGPVADQGFSNRVLQQLPPRRSRIAWPTWLGMLAGMVTCGICVAHVPLMAIGWRDSLSGHLTMPAIAMWLTAPVLSLLALGWGLVESKNR